MARSRQWFWPGWNAPATVPRGQLAFCGLLLISFALLPPAAAQDKPRPDAPADTLAAAVPQLFAKHCQECHSGPMPKGEFSLASLGQNFADPANRDRWEAVAEQLQAGTMPPVKKPRAPAAEVKAALDWIGMRMASVTVARDPAAKSPAGLAGMRRLTRNEYANTIRDLLKVDIDLSDLLPAETNTTGFDTNAESLHISSHLLESYLAAADRAIDSAIASGPRPWNNSKRCDIKNERSIKPTGSVYRHLGDGVAIFATSVPSNIQVTLWQYMTRVRARYRFRITGYAYRTDKPVAFH
ncbi:MAG: DUF1587 domain-containing protein, partial [bacterium]